MARPSPSVADLKLLDPDGRFRARLIADHKTIGALSDSSHDLAGLAPIVHRLAGAAGTFGCCRWAKSRLRSTNSCAVGRR